MRSGGSPHYSGGSPHYSGGQGAEPPIESDPQKHGGVGESPIKLKYFSAIKLEITLTEQSKRTKANEPNSRTDLT